MFYEQYWKQKYPLVMALFLLPKELSIISLNVVKAKHPAHTYWGNPLFSLVHATNLILDSPSPCPHLHKLDKNIIIESST